MYCASATDTMTFQLDDERYSLVNIHNYVLDMASFPGHCPAAFCSCVEEPGNKAILEGDQCIC